MLLGVLLFGSLQEQQWWGRRGYGQGEDELMGKMERGEVGASYRGGGRRREGKGFANPGGGDSLLHGRKLRVT